MIYRSFRSVLMLCALLVVCGESAAQNTASSDADLSGLTLSAGTLDPAFARDSLSYTATVANSIDSLTVMPTSNHNGATITVNGTSVSSGSASSAISLSVGENTITIVVAAEDSTTTKTYTVTVERGVNIPDAALRGDIERALKKSSGAIITPSEMATMTSLSVARRNISNLNLTGLEYATSLEGLALDNNISDISALSGLTSLTYLNLSNNRTSDISASSISDISALSGLTSLTYLNLSGNRISDISALSGLTSLTYLNLSDNNISDISALSGLTSLTHLRLEARLGYNNISDISALSGLTSLKQLVLTGHNISDISALSGLTSLTVLWLSNNRISDISALKGLTSLTNLTLSNNRISDISALKGLTSLTNLTLSNNRISDISALKGLTSLTNLTLSNNRISDISALKGLTSLIDLWLDNNRISDISALSGLTSLEGLALGWHGGGNRISDISALSGLTRLTHLWLENNSISDISALKGLTSLTNLTLSNNSISDISPLKGLTSLRDLNLRDNPLSYPSLTTHIPSFESRGVRVIYDPRTLTSLVKISGDDQTGTAGSRLSDPFIVEVRDTNAVAFAGVPVAFSVTAGSGSLSATTDTTDATGRASTRLTLGAAGADTVVAAIDVSNIDKSVTFTATATGATAEGAAISSTVPDSLTEANLNGAKVNITLTGATYNETLAVNHFALHTAPQGASISGTPVRTSATVAQLTLAYTGLGFDANQSLRVTVKAAAHSGTEDLTTGSVTVTPAQVTGPVTVVTEPGQVAGVEVTPGVGYLGVAWDAVNGATGYKVQWKSGEALYASDRQQVIDNGSKTSATIAGLTAGTEYTVRVIATLTNADDGPPSAGVTGTPSARTTSSDADLSGLTLSAGTLDPAFARDSLSYTATVADSIDSLTVTPTSSYNGATITVNGTSVSSGNASSAISLSVGENTIAIVVTAEDGTTTKTYTVTVERGVNIPDANLRAAIERALKKSSGAIITPSDLTRLTYMETLVLNDNRISDISALSGLTRLRSLWLVNNNISDISALSGLTNLKFLYLMSNPLSYPSLTTHIPAFLSRGVSVYYDFRTLTSLVKISGDGQTGTAGSRLSDPFIVEVRDSNDVAFAGVPVAFSVTAGGGSLSTTTDTTDANGRASTRLTLSAVGANTVKAIIDVSNIDKSVTFTATATGGTTAEGATISSTVPDALTETNLNGAKVNITLTGATYNETLATNHFALHTAPQGVSISGTPVRTSATVAQLTLAYTGLGFDANQSLRVTVKAAAHSGSEDLTTESVTVTPAQVTGPVTVVTEPGQVTGVEVTPGVGNLGVSWNAVNGATGYKVQWKSGDAVYASDRQQVIDTGGKTSATIAGLTAGTEYTVRVIATLTNADDGPPSVGVTGTPSARTTSSDADLSGLTLSAGTLDPAFARDSLAYTATVADSIDSLTVTPTSNHNGATITVNGTSVSSGSASSAISLSVGENTIAIVVTAEDTTTTKTYTVTVDRGVNIPDADLRGAIERALKKSSGAIITPSEMATMTSLSAGKQNTRDLTGLEYATSLERLDLSHNGISDISPLQGLTSLNVLWLQSNSISDISPLKGLTSLSRLLLGSNGGISDISPLQGLTSLRDLRLDANSISDISPLQGLTSLTKLFLQKNSISDISPLQGFTSLNVLWLQDNSISDISSLQGLTSLRELVLTRNGGISDISALSGLTSLTYLYIKGNNISDISALSGLTSLTHLYIKGNPLSYPSLITHIPALQSRGVRVFYDARTLTSLVKISGDDQTGTAGSRLSDPFIVEVRDSNAVAFAGVPVAFSVTAGGGSLSTTTDTTDANGRASTRLTLGAVGANTVVAAIDVSNIDKSVTFTATATGATAEGATISSTVPDSLTETNLNGAKVNITLTGATYNETLAANHFALHTAPQGASISGTPVRTSATVAQLTLAYTGLGFDANQSLRVTVKAAAHSGSEDLTTESVTVTPAQVTGPVTVVTEPGQVTGVEVTPGVGNLGVSWDAVNGVTGYKVQWKSGEALYASDRQQVIDNGGKTSATIAGLTAGTEYTVRVIATLTNADDGPPSVGVTGTPSARTTSSDADLSGLTLSAGTLDPAFARDSLAYTATVANSIDSLTVTPTSNHNGATITVNGTSVSSGSASSAISLSVGENTITIVVAAEDGTTTKTYTVTVERGVNIPDANLRAAIEGALKKSSGAIITPSEMATLTGLDARSQNISDLTGLEHATSLNSLNLFSNNISDISALSGLTSLIDLRLYDNNISDISALSGLTSLERLYLNNNRISDISALSGLTSLESLYLSGNRISDISALSGLTSLEFLLLVTNSISDISALSGLTSLECLYLNNNRISDISPLKGLTSLNVLWLQSNRISDISPLKGLTSLRYLTLDFNRISDISALSGLTSLEFLLLSGNRISDISALSGLTSLRTLGLNNNRISDISALSGLTSLRTLGLNNNHISDISALSGLTSLRTLGLNNNHISDISALSGLTSLEFLVINGTLLNYPSLTTHIPAFQSRGTDVIYDTRTLTSLIKISGDDQTGPAGSRLSDPFIVEVRDSNDVAFAGVPVAFSVTAGSGSLSTTTDTTDANGRASTRLTLGATGTDTVVAAIDVSNIDKSVTFTATATGQRAEGATISSTVPDSLTEANLNGAKVNITLTGATYNETLAANHFALHTAPQGASISGTPVRTSATVAQLTLAYTGLGFDANQSLRVTVKAAAHSGSEDLTTGSVTVTPAQVTGPVTVVTEPGQVTGVEVTPGEGYLGVSWDAVNGATGYKVQWKSGEALYASDRQQVIDNGSKTSATIAGLTAGTEYTVRVIATLTNADDGPPSVGVTGTPSARTTSPPSPVTLTDADTPSANLDVDGNGRVGLFSDIILITRYVLFFREEALINRAVSSDATRTTPQDIESYIAILVDQKILDVDGNGRVELFSDIILITRYILFFREEALINRAVSSDATRTTPQDIESYIRSLYPDSHFQ